MSFKFPTLSNIAYKNDIDLIDSILKIYSIALNKSLRNFERDVLNYYIYYGYSKETKEIIKQDLGKKDGDIRVADVHLRDKGFLVHGKNNKRKSSLSDNMESIRQSFIIDKKEIYVLHFSRQ